MNVSSAGGQPQDPPRILTVAICTVVVLRRPQHSWPLVLGANRDEMIARPWRAPARHWPEYPHIVGGLDELGGGSWMALGDAGVAACVLNREGSLGPAPGMRSRGALVFEALVHPCARDAANAIARSDLERYRPFNLVLADRDDAFVMSRRATGEVVATQLEPGLHMLAAGEVDDPGNARLAAFRPRFLSAPPPDPDAGDWTAWEALLASEDPPPGGAPADAMRFATDSGFATLSHAILALPDAPRAAPVWRFASAAPDPEAWRTLDLSARSRPIVR